MICIIGVGSVGKNILDSLIKLTTYDVALIDNDIVCSHNIQYNKKYIGKKKIDVCKEIYKDRITEIINEYIDYDNISTSIKKILKKSEYVFDCTDIFINRKTFEAIKIYINKDRLIADFQKKIIFNHQVEGEYVKHINDTQLKLLTSQFIKLFISEKNAIASLQNNNTAISVNNMGFVEKLKPVRSMVSKDIKEFFRKKCKKDINKIQVDVMDGPYHIFDNIFNIENDCHISDVLQEIDNNISHLPAVYLTSYIKNKDTLKITLMSQAGGA